MANNNDNHEAYMEVPVSDYVVIGEIAIHKNWTLGTMGFSAVLTSLVWYLAMFTRNFQNVGAQIQKFMYQNIWLPLAIIGLVALTVTIFFFTHKNKQAGVKK